MQAFQMESNGLLFCGTKDQGSWSSKARDEMPQPPPPSGSQSRLTCCAGLGLHHILPVLTGKDVLTDKGYRAKNATIQYNVFHETVFKICIQIPNNDIIIKCYQTKRHAPEFYSVANGES